MRERDVAVSSDATNAIALPVPQLVSLRWGWSSVGCAAGPPGVREAETAVTGRCRPPWPMGLVCGSGMPRTAVGRGGWRECMSDMTMWVEATLVGSSWPRAGSGGSWVARWGVRLRGGPLPWRWSLRRPRWRRRGPRRPQRSQRHEMRRRSRGDGTGPCLGRSNLGPSGLRKPTCERSGRRPWKRSPLLLRRQRPRRPAVRVRCWTVPGRASGESAVPRS